MGPVAKTALVIVGSNLAGLGARRLVLGVDQDPVHTSVKEALVQAAAGAAVAYAVTGRPGPAALVAAVQFLGNFAVTALAESVPESQQLVPLGLLWAGSIVGTYLAVR